MNYENINKKNKVNSVTNRNNSKSKEKNFVKLNPILRSNSIEFKETSNNHNPRTTGGFQIKNH